MSKTSLPARTAAWPDKRARKPPAQVFGQVAASRQMAEHGDQPTLIADHQLVERRRTAGAPSSISRTSGSCSSYRRAVDSLATNEKPLPVGEPRAVDKRHGVTAVPILPAPRGHPAPARGGHFGREEHVRFNPTAGRRFRRHRDSSAYRRIPAYPLGEDDAPGAGSSTDCRRVKSGRDPGSPQCPK